MKLKNLRFWMIAVIMSIVTLSGAMAVGIYGSENPDDYVYFNSFKNGTVNGGFTSSGMTIDNTQNPLDGNYSSYTSCNGDSCAYTTHSYLSAPNDFCVQVETQGASQNAMILVWSQSAPPNEQWKGTHLVYSTTCGTGGFYDSGLGSCLVNNVNQSKWYVHSVCYSGSTWSYYLDNSLILANSSTFIFGEPSPVGNSYYFSSRHWSGNSNTFGWDGYKVWTGSFEDRPEETTPEFIFFEDFEDTADESVPNNFTKIGDGTWTVEQDGAISGTKSLILESSGSQGWTFFNYDNLPTTDDYCFYYEYKSLGVKATNGLLVRNPTGDDGYGAILHTEPSGTTDIRPHEFLSGAINDAHVSDYESLNININEQGNVTGCMIGNTLTFTITNHNTSSSVTGDMTDTTYTTGGVGFIGYQSVPDANRDLMVDNFCVFSSGYTIDDCSSSPAPTLPVSLYSGLIYNLSFDINSTEIIHGEVGTINGATYTTVGCLSEGCYDFDGDQDYITYADSSYNDLTPTGFTLNLWVDFDRTGTTEGLISKFNNINTDWWVGQKDSGGLRSMYQDSSSWLVDDVATVNISESWEMLTTTFDGSTWTFYRNGQFVGVDNSGSSITDNAKALYIGTLQFSTSTYDFDGRLDEIKLWDRSLNSSEVLELFNEEKTVACVEDWQPYYTVCDVTDNQTLYYIDSNACGTTDDLPVDNSTMSACNYCTSTWDETVSVCVGNQITTTYDYTNTCCFDTGLPSDCDIPANTTSSCIGIHQSEDVSNVVIDGLVEFGIEATKYVGIIALIGLATWVMFLI